MALFGLGKKNRSAAPAALNDVTLSDGHTFRLARSVDCLGDSCPRPQLMTKKALGECAAQDVIEILVDNPTSMEAIPPLLGEFGATHLETLKTDRHWQIYVRKN